MCVSICVLYDLWLISSLLIGTGRSKHIYLVETCELDISLAQVHIQQVGQRELRRAPALHKRAVELSKKEAIITQKAGVKAHL